MTVIHTSQTSRKIPVNFNDSEDLQSEHKKSISTSPESVFDKYVIYVCYKVIFELVFSFIDQSKFFNQ